jgi:hypothetical protein
MSPRSPLLVGALVAALLTAGCGEDNPKLIPQGDADQLTALVDEAAQASAAGDCDRARRFVREAESSLAGLPRKTDRQLKRNVRDWLDHLDSAIADECGKQEEPTETATPSQTSTPTPSATATETPTPTPATPTPTPTPSDGSPTGGAQGPSEEPDGVGGVPSDQGTSDQGTG